MRDFTIPPHRYAEFFNEANNSATGIVCITTSLADDLIRHVDSQEHHITELERQISKLKSNQLPSYDDN